MGGSAVGGDLARVALGDHASRPVVVSRDYGLPGWTTPDTTVLCASYSGDTDETLAAFEAAGALGGRRVAVTTGGELADLARREDVPVIPVPGGFQPRVAVAYMTVAALEVAAACGAGPRLASEIDVAADHLDQLCAEWGPDANDGNIAKEIALALHGSVPVIAGAGLTAPVAYRWKTQVNENAKIPAFAGELPEIDHNEIVGWQGTAGLGSFAAVFLEDADQHPRIGDRIELTERADRRARDAGHPRQHARPGLGRAGHVARAARRPRLAVPRRAPGHRPDPGAGHRPAQGASRRAVTG